MIVAALAEDLVIVGVVLVDNNDAVDIVLMEYTVLRHRDVTHRPKKCAGEMTVTNADANSRTTPQQR